MVKVTKEQPKGQRDKLSPFQKKGLKKCPPIYVSDESSVVTKMLVLGTLICAETVR